MAVTELAAWVVLGYKQMQLIELPENKYPFPKELIPFHLQELSHYLSSPSNERASGEIIC